MTDRSFIEVMGTIAYGRDISVEIASMTDEFGQFQIRLLVDGKERFTAHFTAESEEPNEALERDE